jgi:methylated-DNA-protein-cysteine methyltransferase-like protein
MEDNEVLGMLMPAETAVDAVDPELPLYARIHAIVAQIPHGHVSTYGRIAKLAGRCTPRHVGFALAALPSDTDVPWHRVVNARGALSPRGDGAEPLHQHRALKREGIRFDSKGIIDLNRYGWPED